MTPAIVLYSVVIQIVLVVILCILNEHVYKFDFPADKIDLDLAMSFIYGFSLVPFLGLALDIIGYYLLIKKIKWQTQHEI